jgi:hypothetical protein
MENQLKDDYYYLTEPDLGNKNIIRIHITFNVLSLLFKIGNIAAMTSENLIIRPLESCYRRNRFSKTFLLLRYE